MVCSTHLSSFMWPLSAILIGYSKCLHLLHLKGLFYWLFIISLPCCILKVFIILLFYWLLYSEITETRTCNLGLITLLLLRLMYSKLIIYLIKNSQAVKKGVASKKARVKKDVKSKVASKKWL